MSGHKIKLAFGLILMAPVVFATDTKWEATSPSNQVQVVELYTSQTLLGPSG